MKEKKLFAGGGMDMDTEERFLKTSDYRYALNCRITSVDEENAGAVENIRGNQILSFGLVTKDGTTLEDNRFKVIGHYEDKKLGILYYFVCDLDGNDRIGYHCIVSNYAWGTGGGRPGAFRVLYESPSLNFHKNNLITGVNMIHSDEFAPDGILYWTDDRNQPRKLDVKRVFWYYSSLVNGTTISDPTLAYQSVPDLNAISRPPLDNPIVGEFTYTDVNGNIQFTTGNNTSIKANDIVSTLWQFKYRYVYRDFTKSSWSPISPSGMTSFNDASIDDLSISNYLEVKIDSGNDEVISIELAVRENEDKSDFYLISKIDKDGTIQKNTLLASTMGALASQNIGDVITDGLPDYSPLYYIFTNNEPRIPINLPESNKLFDDVPLKAKAQEIIDGNRLAYGNVVNGYDPIPTDTEFEVVYTPNSAQRGNVFPINLSYKISNHKWTGGGVNPWMRRYFKSTMSMDIGDITSVPPGTLITISIRDIGLGLEFARPSSTVCSKYATTALWKLSVNFSYFVTATNNDMVQFVAAMNAAAIINLEKVDQQGDNGTKPVYGFDHDTSDGRPNGPSSSNFSGTNGSAFHINGNKVDFRMAWSHNERYRDKCLSIEPVMVMGFDGAVLYSVDPSLNSNVTTSAWPAQTPNVGPIKYNGWDYPEIATRFLTPGVWNNMTYPVNSFGSPWIAENNSFVLGPVATSISNLRGFKSGIKHSLGIVYYDEYNRSGTVNPCGDIYVPFRNERSENLDSQFNPVTNNPLHDAAANIHFKINHPAPLWASHWQWVWAPTKRGEFLHVTVNTLEHDPAILTRYRTVLPESQDEVGTQGDGGMTGFQSLLQPTGALGMGYVKMDMEELIRHSGNTSMDTFMWQWAPGDRVRILSEQTVGIAGAPNAPDNYAGMDFEIIGIDEDVTNAKLWFILEKAASGPVLTSGTAIDVRIELYRPVKIKSDVYYEIGHVNSCQDGKHMVNRYATEEQLPGSNRYLFNTGLNTPNTYHFNQTSAVPAEGTIRNGDVYLRERHMPSTGSGPSPIPAGGLIIVEDYSYSDFFKSPGWDLGRVNAYLPDFKQTRREASIFYSEPYVPNTAINGLSTFYPDVSFQEFDLKFNSIQKLFSINDRLIILQEDKVSFSMVSRAVLFDASGNQNVATSKNVLSQSVPYSGDFGISTNPESFVNFGFRSYFVDAKNYAVLRLSQNGLTTISEHGMKNFFTDYFQELRDRGMHKSKSLRIYGAYDNKFDEYVVCAETLLWNTLDVNQNQVRNVLRGFTVGFNEPYKRWNSFYSYANYIATYDSSLHSMRFGTIYKHNAAEDAAGNALYNNFYGLPTTSKLEFAFNKFPDVTKVYHNISEHSNNIWAVEALYTRNNQLTDISLEEFTGGNTFTWEDGHGTKENIHNAVIRCDVLTPGLTIPKIEGNRMRDTSIMCRLSLDNVTGQAFTVLFGVSISFITSSGPNLVGE